jgi:natural product biosynthesis luciferase-like monooxygenase protein
MSNRAINCNLIGSKSLLLYCANSLIKIGIPINGVLSDDPDVKQWMDSRDIPCFALNQKEKLIEMGQVDYVFSISHLAITPASIIQLARQHAINVHDGLLPDFAGPNATTRAIHQQRDEHGISWHEMTENIGCGGVFLSKRFGLDNDETVFTLNAKCYDAAMGSFNGLIEQIQQGTLTVQAHGAPERFSTAQYYRPEHAACLDFKQSASSLNAQVRGINFESYANNIGLMRLYTPEASYFVRRCEVSDTASDLPAGTLISTTPALEISTQDQDLRITELIDAQGNMVTAEQFAQQTNIDRGKQLAEIDADTAHHIDKINHQAAKAETYWLERLNQLEPLEIPYVESRSVEQSQSVNRKAQTMALPASLNEQDFIHSLALYMARISKKSCFDIAYIHHVENDTRYDQFFESCLPLRLKLNDELSVKDSRKLFLQQLEEFQNKPGYNTDLPLRQPSWSEQLDKHHAQSLDMALLRGKAQINDPAAACMSAPLILQLDNGQCHWHYDNHAYSDTSIERMMAQLQVMLDAMQQDDNARVVALPVIPDIEQQRLLTRWNETELSYDQNICVHQLFEQQVEKTPDAIALTYLDEHLSYKELNQQSNRLAHYLISQGVTADTMVGVLCQRSPHMLISMLAILKAGGAYLPLDPEYPLDRLSYMMEDCRVKLVLSESDQRAFLTGRTVAGSDLSVVYLDENPEILKSQNESNPENEISSSNLSYIIYTSGSTGKPKGVMVEHRNVVNFIFAMDQSLRHDIEKPGVWLAETSISFDISVLELFWTLARGFQIILHTDADRKSARKAHTRYPNQDIDFSLFYWNISNEESEQAPDKYRLLMESAQFGDKNNFKAVWMPERHFHAFGGLFPNPAITAAAVASVTKNIHLRAGSCVVPLHSPIRIAEEWAVVDNISGGRVGMAVAPGWQPQDFVIKPENHKNAKQIMFDNTNIIKKLWRGETVEFESPTGPADIRTLPRPLQKELPVWVTTAGNPETYAAAAREGNNVLTHLLGQATEELGEKIAVYRQIWKECGHPGEGHVTVMLHTLVGPDDAQIKELAREPMKRYLKTAVGLVKAAAWHFPAFKDLSDTSNNDMDNYFDSLSEQDLDDLLEFAFERYFEHSGLFGSVDKCIEMVDSLKEIGVDEVAALIDFGLDTNTALDHLSHLNQLRSLCQKQTEMQDNENHQQDQSIPALLERYNVSHFQCTPTRAAMLSADPAARECLKKINCMMVGGEAFPLPLANDLQQLIPGRLINMYGPTECTIWSSTYNIMEQLDKVSIGRPIGNTQLYIVDEKLRPVPEGVAGELLIAGDGVVRGYFERPELNEERFVADPYSKNDNARMYRTGDLVRYRHDGLIDYLGRMDNQVKIFGYRIELGEIEAQILQHPDVYEAAVILYSKSANDKRLIAYMSAKAGAKLDTESIQTFVQKDLPHFMRPGVYIHLDKLPLTPNGKIDRNALPEPDQQNRQTKQAEYIQPENDLQKTIADIWQGTLGVHDIGMSDNFFDLGGHSLLVIEVLGKLREVIEKPIKMTDMFRFPTIAQLSDFLAAENEDPNAKLAGSKDRAAARKNAIGRRRKNKN